MNGDKQQVLKKALGAVKMHDPGRKPTDYSKPMPVHKPEKYYPSISLTSKEAPFLEGYKVGDTCTIVIKTKITSHHSSANKHNSSSDYRLEICKIGQIDHNGQPASGGEY